MKINKFIMIIALLLIMALLTSFIFTPVVKAKTDKFYYIGAQQSVPAIEDNAVRSVSLLSAAFDFILGLRFYGERLIMVGLIALAEWTLVVAIDKICGTDLQDISDNYSTGIPVIGSVIDSGIDIFDSIHNTKNRITFEKIIFNQIDLFNANIFDLEGHGDGTLEK